MASPSFCVRRFRPQRAFARSDTVDLARFGALDITRVNFASLNNQSINPFPATQVMSLPCVFDSTEHMRVCYWWVLRLAAAKAIGIDPVHFGVILILKGGLGLITPPIGPVLFVGTAIDKISVGNVLPTSWPFYLAVLVVLLAVAFVPTLSLWLPSFLRAAPLGNPPGHSLRRPGPPV